MHAYICTACGTQFPASAEPPRHCPVCEDERQFVPPSGQGWTTPAKLSRSHTVTFREEAGLLGIGTAPAFGIGQRALLVRSPAGNVLWDCISLITDTMVELLNGLGGITAIAISHPHYYAAMVSWSRAFGGIPVHLHAGDRAWAMDPDPCLSFWEGDTGEIAPGMTLIRTGGHFEGGTVMHWAGGAAGRGALLVGDILQVVPDRRHLGFMRSYPNFIPLGANAVRKIAERLAPWEYEAVYGAFWDRVIASGGKQAVMASVARHLAWLEREAL